MKRSEFAGNLARISLLLLLALGNGGVLRAQSTTDGAISGIVYDSSGGAVPNAKVSVRNNGTNLELNTTTDEGGFFRVLKLQPASYTLKVESAGFAGFTA